jgi:aminoglycoside phosphotransferase family enzyme/predicted kinase
VSTDAAARGEAARIPCREDLVRFLLDPKSYPRRPRRVRLEETHASLVFIAPPYVYKVKKAVNFGFLDFSTLEKRRFYCGREVELNRRLSPSMYLGVVPISRTGGRLAFGEGDQVVEYAVKMRNLSARRFLDKLVERGEAGAKDIDRVATVLGRFYRAQHPTAEIEEWGRIDRLKVSTDENFRQTEPFIGHPLSRAAFEAIRFYTNEFYIRRAKLFESRIKERWIRDCHGDLRLEHIHVTPRELLIYDCIEFNDRLRYVDVANDVAFLAMDLDHAGRPELAKRFAAEIAAALGDSGMGWLMDFYKCYRAYVRGKVECLRGAAAGASGADRKESAGRARRHFQLALRYAVAGSEPMVLVVMGRVGSGKSALARALGNELDWPVFSSDRARKQIAGVPLFERGDEAARGRLYSAAMTRKTYDQLLNDAIEQTRQHRGAILDATFGRRAERDRLRARFAAEGVHFRFVEARADDAVVMERLRLRASRPDEVSDARLEDFETLSKLFEPPSEPARNKMILAQTTGPPDKTLAGALQDLVHAHLALLERRDERNL